MRALFENKDLRLGLIIVYFRHFIDLLRGRCLTGARIIGRYLSRVKRSCPCLQVLFQRIAAHNQAKSAWLTCALSRAGALSWLALSRICYSDFGARYEEVFVDVR